MSGAVTIATRELAAAFSQPRAYAMVAGFIAWLVVTTLLFDDVLLSGVVSMRRPFGWMATGLLLWVPAMSMGLLQTGRLGSMAMLGSLPLSDSSIVLGKWLSVVAWLCLGLGLTLPWPLMLASFGRLDVGSVIGGYLALVLTGGSLAALGVAASAMWRHPGAAFLLTVGLGVFGWLLGFAASVVPSGWLWLAQSVAFDTHFSAMTRGALDLRSVLYFVSITVFALRLAVHALEERRLA